MKRLLGVILVAVLLLPAATANAHEVLRVNLYPPTCQDHGWKVEVLNHLTHTVRVEMLVIDGRQDHIIVPPGGFMGMRVPTAKLRSKVLVVRPSIRSYRSSGWGLLVRGYANLSGCAA
jgi:hypothetical protein